MYPPDMIDENGRPMLEGSVMMEDQARMLRRSGARGSYIVSGAGRQET
jgi:hypothetical protein